MKIKSFLFGLILFGMTVAVHAQSNLVLSPEKPKPGDKVSFSYSPSKDVFNETDEVNCIIYKWVNYKDEYVFAKNIQPMPVEIALKKNGNRYEGTIATDSLTVMLSFLFTSGDVKWKMADNKMALTDGKVDNNNNSGYCIQLHNQEGRECKYSNYFRGLYLLMPGFNNTGISNTDGAAGYMIKELELYPDSKYIVFNWLGYALANNPDKLKSIASGEMEKLFEAGLSSEKDLDLMSRVSSVLKLNQQAVYFYKQLIEKYKDGDGLRHFYSLYGAYFAEADFGKKEKIINEHARAFNALSFDDKVKLIYQTSNPYYLKRIYLQDLVFAGRLDEFKSAAARLKVSLENNPYDTYTFPGILDSLLKGSIAGSFAEKTALENYRFYTERLSKINAGATLPANEYDKYYTVVQRKEAVVNGALTYADYCAQVFYKAGAFKKGMQYAKEAQNYMQMLKTPPSFAPDINYRFCVLAEKAMTARQAKAAVEKIIAGGHYTPGTLDILKRFYVNEKKTEAGFDEYVKSLKQGTFEEMKKTLLASQLNEPAPKFVLKDLEGKLVSMEELKGKTIIVDFWATWCGPCIASFPGMQKLVTFYKDNPDVVFVFIASWQSEANDDAKLKAVSEFINSKKYSFRVLMDNTNKVVESFKIKSIPTKFIIDKNGIIRYKVMGAELNETKLFDEMNVMLQTVGVKENKPGSN